MTLLVIQNGIGRHSARETSRSGSCQKRWCQDTVADLSSALSMACACLWLFFLAWCWTHGLQVSCCVSLVCGYDFLCVPDCLCSKQAEYKIGSVPITRIGGSNYDVKCSLHVLTTQLDGLVYKRNGDNLRPRRPKKSSVNSVNSEAFAARGPHVYLLQDKVSAVWRRCSSVKTHSCSLFEGNGAKKKDFVCHAMDQDALFKSIYQTFAQVDSSKHCRLHIESLPWKYPCGANHLGKMI